MNNKIIKIVGLVLLVLILTVLFFCHVLTNGFKGICNDEPIGKYESPNSKHEIDYYIRDCGATTGFVNNIEIDGNLIVRAEPNDGDYAPFHVKWADDKHVSIDVVASTTSMRIYRRPLSNYRGIDILLDPKIISSYNAYQRL